jgi:DNA adenine methylase
MSNLILYPSGKRPIRWKLDATIERVAGGKRMTYREPFLGGGTMALHYLEHHKTDAMWINDKDVSLVCFWRAVLEYSSLLLDRIDRFVPSIPSWHAAKRRCLDQDTMPSSPAEIVDVGFDRLFVQKCAHSGHGTLAGNVRGGTSQQRNQYLDRWTPNRMKRYCRKTLHWVGRLDVFQLTNIDYESLIEDESEQCILFLDPPYWSDDKTLRLYQHHFIHDDHVRLAQLLRKTRHKWVLTYGDHPQIRRMYQWANIEAVEMKSCLNWKNRTDLIISS